MGCIESELDLTASLGISDSKYLAKVCSSFAKPRGLTVLLRAEVATKLWPRPVDTLYGVGERTAERLRALGCESVGDVARTPVQVLKHAFGVYGETLHDLARGRDRWRVVTPREAADARSIGHRRTLSTDFHERSRIEAFLCNLAEKVARRARRYGLAGRRVVVTLRDPRFHTITHGRVLPEPVDSAEAIFAVACSLLGETRFWERGVRMVGITLQLLVPAQAARQLHFEFSARGERTSPVVDSIRSKYGEHAIGLARTLESGRRSRRGPRHVSFQPPREMFDER
jgi:DNA polymerase-4